MRSQITNLSTIALVVLGIAVFAVGSANADSLTNNNYHAYDNTAQGAGTISPFAAIFGAISERDPVIEVGFPVNVSIHDFRGLSSTPAVCCAVLSGWKAAVIAFIFFLSCASVIPSPILTDSHLTIADRSFQNIATIFKPSQKPITPPSSVSSLLLLLLQ